MAESMGIDTARSKIVAFLIAALFAALSGWMYAHMQRFVNPTPFGLGFGNEYLFMAVIGGASHVWGAVLGAGVVTILKQWLQDLLPALLGQTGNFEVIVFGVLMVLVLQRAPEGLWPIVARVFASRERSAAREVPRAEPLPRRTLPRRTLPARGTTLLEVRGVTKRYGGLLANHRIDLDV